MKAPCAKWWIGAIALMGLPLTGQAQITVTDSLSTDAIAQLLAGLNVSISNVTVTCAGSAMGQFSGPSELDIDQGLVLTTGSADALAGPVGNFASAMLAAPGDPDLTMDAGYITNDACVLEFDCIPYGDTLLFNFSFGSEEYPEFVGTAFNDIFAIYLSGPGIMGQENAAKLPDGTPVAINNVNIGTNAEYYHDNETVPGQYVSYDGFTQNLTAFAVVVPDQAYHFKVAIADASDGIFDSGVFLEAFSFRSVLNTSAVGELAKPALHMIRQGDLLQLSWPAGLGSSDLVVLDAMGRTVRHMAVSGQMATMDASQLPAGAYTLLLRGGASMPPLRFVKQ